MHVLDGTNYSGLRPSLVVFCSEQSLQNFSLLYRFKTFSSVYCLLFIFSKTLLSLSLSLCLSHLQFSSRGTPTYNQCYIKCSLNFLLYTLVAPYSSLNCHQFTYNNVFPIQEITPSISASPDVLDVGLCQGHYASSSEKLFR